MAIAALDLGSHRIGLAATDPAGLAVHPLGSLKRSSLAADIQAVLDALAGREIERVIVGLPVNMDGSEGPAARTARAFAARFTAATGVATELQDERLSTFEAESRMAGRVRRTKRKRASDAIAAAVILESWLGMRGHG